MPNNYIFILHLFISLLVSFVFIANFPKQEKEVKFNKKYLADYFDYPVGKPNGDGYYNAQKFKENNHLGEDWNRRW